MELFLFTIYLIIWIGLTIKRKKKEGFYSIFFLFGLGGFVYFVAIPFEMYVSGKDYYFVHYWIKLGFRERILILLMGVISLVSFYLGLTLSRYRLLPDKKNILHTLNCFKKYRFDRFFIALLSIIVLSGTTLILFYVDLFAAQWDYSTAYFITYISPIYSFIKTHFLISLCLVAALILHWKKGKTISLIIVILVAFIGILTSDKDPLLLAMLTVAYFIGFRQMSFRKFTVIAAFGILGVIIAVVVFNLLRTRMPIGDILYNAELRQFSFTVLDPAGPLVSIVAALNDTLSLRYGTTYITSLGILVPKVIWPNRPLTLSEEFARQYIFRWKEGEGLGFSPLAEAYLNFHLLGSFLHFFAYGLLLGWFLNVLRRKVFINQDALFTSFVYILVYHTIVMSFRGPFISLIKMTVLFMVPYCVLFILQRFSVFQKR